MCYPTSLLLSALLDFPWQINEKRKDYAVERVVEFRSRTDAEFKKRWDYIHISYNALSPFQRLPHPLLKWSYQGYQIQVAENVQAADVDTWMTVNPVSGEPMQESEFSKSSPEAFLEWDHWMADIDEWRAQSGAIIVESVGSWIVEADNSFTPFASFSRWSIRPWALPALLEYPGSAVFTNPLSNSWKLAGVLGCIVDGVVSHVVDWVYPVSRKEDFLEEFKPLLETYMVDSDTMRKDNTHQLQPVYPFGTLQLHLNCYSSLEDEIYRAKFARAILSMEEKALLRFEARMFEPSDVFFTDERTLAQALTQGRLPYNDAAAQEGERYTSLDILKLQTLPRAYSSRPVEVFLGRF
ncbi:MAG: hypothetical protein UT63_C0104G0008 [Candidatus Gottesmanbacteria bacterium GW2011_GWC2_39_8]|nr:MAG: hypothetical protein UT63_C0104G0008 [Candidatus Gottesmanbacteria bacterium GW2011_GWC2_39_8]